MDIRIKHNELKKLVSKAESLRQRTRGSESWYNLRALKKEKLSVKDDFYKLKTFTN